MVKFIVLSEDSAFNTDLFLQTLKTFVVGEFSCTVIYKASTPDYSLMYEAIFKEHDGVCDYVKVRDFKEQILIDLTERTEEDYVCLCTSEDIFYRPFVVPKLDEIFKDKDILTYQTRLGKNIKQNTVVGSENIFKPETEKDGLCIWDWSVHYVDFNEPFNIHGGIYRKDEIKKLINKVSFESREELQEGLTGMFGNYPKHKAACNKKSTLVTQRKDPNPKTAHLTKMLTNIKLLKGARYKFTEFDLKKTEEVTKDIGVLSMLTGEEKAKVS